jgi:hypothetical protein
MNLSPSDFDRRTMIKLVALAGAATAGPLRGFAQSNRAGSGASRAITDYLQTLARPDGGYAWGDQEMSHLTPTLGVIGCYQVLRQTPPNKDALVQFVRTHHPREVKKLEQERRIFDWQQVQALTWLKADASEFRSKIAALTKPLGYLKQYERHGYPIFQSELGAVMYTRCSACRRPESPMRSARTSMNAGARMAASTTRPRPTAATGM